MATFWEIAARSVGGLFSLYFVCLWCLFVSRFGFGSGICLLIAPVPVHCFSVAFKCTKFSSVNDEEWICHTCMGAIRDGKVPKLSVANGMKWPEKPPELDLHQLEERLIS